MYSNMLVHYKRISRSASAVAYDMEELPNQDADHAGNQDFTAADSGVFFANAVKLSLLGLLAYWSFTLIRPFLTIIVWSLILTVTFYPAFNWVAAHIGGRRKLAAAIVTAVCLIVFAVPIVWLGMSMAEGLTAFGARLNAGAFTIPPPPDDVKTWPLIGETVHRIWGLGSTNLKSALAEAWPHLDPLRDLASKLGQSAATGIPSFFVSLIAAGFLFCPALSLLEGGRSLIRRLLPEHGQEYVKLAGATIRNVSQGLIGIALLQAVLAGAGFLAAGVPGAGLLAAAVLFFGILQLPGLVLLPVIIWGWFVMTPLVALAFTAYFAAVALINDFLGPIAMAHGLRTPTIVIFLGVLGGGIAHGVIGLFIGPIILAVMWELIAAWVEREEARASPPDSARHPG